MTLQEIDAELGKDPEMLNLAKSDPTEFTTQYNAILKMNGLDEHGGPLSLVNRGANALERTTGIPAEAIKGAGTMGLSIAGTVAGGSIGALAGPAGALGGAMIGSLAGEKAAEGLGLRSKMDITDTALAVGMPGVGPALSRGIAGAKYLSRFLPNAGVALSELAGENAQQAVNRIRVPAEAVTAARSVMENVGDFRINMPKLRALLDAELTTKARAVAIPGVEADIKKLNEVRAELGTDSKNAMLSFKKLMAWEKELNDLKHEDVRGIWTKASGVLIQDIEDAMNNPGLSKTTREKAAAGFNAFKQFVVLNKSNKADKALDSLLTRSYTPSTGDPSLYKFNVGIFNKTLDTNADLNDAFTPAELKSVKDAVANIGYITVPPTNNPITNPMTFAAGGVGYAVSGMPGSKGAFGVAATLTAIAQGLKTDRGRQFIKYLATNGKGKINSLELQSMLGKITAGAISGGTSVQFQSPEGSTNAFPNQE